jgi:hypothetical protein
MNSAPPLEDLTRTLRVLYRANPSAASSVIEEYLQSSLKDLNADHRLHTVRVLLDRFSPRSETVEPVADERQDERLTELVWRVLGEKALPTVRSKSQSMEALADALNSVFDHLNQLVVAIQSTLLGRNVELETIRQVIRSDIEGEGRSESIQAYLDHIREAFLIASRAYTLAARREVEKILLELDPEHLSESSNQGLKFGFMRKGEAFELYQEKFNQFRRWFESDRFSKDFAREFEKICQKLYAERGGAP